MPVLQPAVSTAAEIIAGSSIILTEFACACIYIFFITFLLIAFRQNSPQNGPWIIYFDWDANVFYFL